MTDNIEVSAQTVLSVSTQTLYRVAAQTIAQTMVMWGILKLVFSTTGPPDQSPKPECITKLK